MIVTMTAEQLDAARDVGRRRNRFHRERGRPSRKVMGHGNTSESIDEMGAIAELAVAFAFGLCWTGRLFETLDEWRAFVGCDVDGLEVRSRSTADGALIIQPWDLDHRRIVLATMHDLPRVHLVGWLRVGDGKRAHFWQKPPAVPRAAWFVPQHRLRPISLLMLHEELNT